MRPWLLDCSKFESRPLVAGGDIRRKYLRPPDIVNPLHKEDWHQMKEWYKAMAYRAQPLTRIAIN